MIDIQLINSLFNTTIRKKGIAQVLNKTHATVRMMRWRHTKKNDISLELKLRVLQQAGVPLETYKYNHADMVSLLNYYQHCSMAARELGNEYIVEKWANRTRELSGKAKL